ncbi:SagB/ThcOx family dehydrogenase [Leucobacter insecticola]|uniref:SagB/ThcOx family dehydrogenase n=1 Tax=Leucobacter insecticola TaxID=2714934 RepID=A0A6G8FFP2_9MICO|nr:SagB/ThcOx family dehydrogenase [Leucobacter insecticola]QIM15191.1 SagB/ThcOx family dehydrogenase [Leucobacter insecticola]
MLRQRRSPRRLSLSEVLTLEQIGWLCWATDGSTGEIAPEKFGRTAPSAGALYPRDLYVATIAGAVPQGLYHYNPYRHELEYVNATTPSDLAQTSPQPDELSAASTVLLFSTSFWRNRMKYDQRGVRFAFMELGHVAQNALLAGNALGLSALSLGGFFDDEVNALVGLDGLHETSAYMVFLRQTEPREATRRN